MSGRLKPFFGYFGSKWKLSGRYNPPQEDTLIEPFAGSAGYAMRYPGKKVILYDAFEPVYMVWDYLIHANESEIRALPDLPEGAEVDDLKDVCQEARYLIGYWIVKASATPRQRGSKWMHMHDYVGSSWWGEKIRNRIASQLHCIQHWKIVHASYVDIPNQRATWFVDPPYQHQGKSYPKNGLDYPALGEWCRGREGQVIVCEGEGANWLPFVPLDNTSRTKTASKAGTENRERAQEWIWENDRLSRSEPSSASLVRRDPERPIELLTIEKALMLLRQAKTTDEVKSVRDRAHSLKLYLRSRKAGVELQNDASEMVLWSDRRGGEILDEMGGLGHGSPACPIPRTEVPLIKGRAEKETLAEIASTYGVSKGAIFRIVNNKIRVFVDDPKKPTCEELGIDSHTVSRWKALAPSVVPESDFITSIRTIRSDGRKLTAPAILRLLNEKRRAARAAAGSDEEACPRDPVRVIQKYLTPKLPLTDEQIDQLITWLQSQKCARSEAA